MLRNAYLYSYVVRCRLAEGLKILRWGEQYTRTFDQTGFASISAQILGGRGPPPPCFLPPFRRPCISASSYPMQFVTSFAGISKPLFSKSFVILNVAYIHNRKNYAKCAIQTESSKDWLSFCGFTRFLSENFYFSFLNEEKLSREKSNKESHARVTL